MSDQSQCWYCIEADQAAQELGVDLKTGLSKAESRSRLLQHGPNELVEQPRPSFFEMLLDQFKEFLVLILVVAAIVSSIIGWVEYNETGEFTEFIDAGAIVAIVILNAILGVVQQSKAEEALAALKKMAAPDARVIRDGHRLTIPARELVPGDLVLLEAGNHVPADVRLVESVNLKVEEASLTGESVPVNKRADVKLEPNAPLGDRRNMAYMSTTVTYGRGTGLVVGTGMDTEIGRIADMIQQYEQEATPLQVKLDQLGKWLGIASLAICALVFVVGVLRGVEFLDMFLIAVSLAIAAVPEGLPAVVTICLALGMREMVRRHALIRRLPAVETLGSASVICSDKTGTLTQNEMMVTHLAYDGAELTLSGEGYRPWGFFHQDGRVVQIDEQPRAELLLRGGMLCNDALLEVTSQEEEELAYNMVGDPTEGALVVAAAKAGLWRDEQSELLPRVAEVPFDSVRKRMSTIHKVESNGVSLPSSADYIAFVKGAPDIVLELCSHTLNLEGDEVISLDEAQRQIILERNKDMAGQALRVLAVAYRPLESVPPEPTADEIERDLVFIGLAGMIDPARPEAAAGVEVARSAGIRTVMVTGDYPDTAQAIADKIGLLRPNGQVVTGSELSHMDERALTNRVDDIDVFARVSPEHKVRIVEALKARDQVVAMTGDGVNDAPALKRANIGVAMGITGTDVSKETADMVLTDDNYVSIVSAVEQGRIIYSNIRKFVYYLLSCNLAEIMIIFIAMLANWPTPLTAIQLLWLNLLTDGAPALALGLEKGDPDIMERPPRPTREPIVNREMRVGMVIQTIAITVAVLVAFRVGLAWDTADAILGETMAFVTLSTSELFRAYTSRSEHYSLWGIGVFSNKYMQYAVALSVVLLALVIYVPFLQPIFNTMALGLREWAVMFPLILLPSVAAEITKWFLRRADQRRRAEMGVQ